MDFFSQQSVWIYLMILVGKIIEVSIATVRIMLISRGEKTKGSILMLAEVSLWLIITGTVLVGFQEDIWRSAVFVLACAIGSYIGSLIEGKLAFGLCSIQVIVAQDNMAHENAAMNLAESLRANNYAVTVMEGRGKKGKRDILVLHLKRKRIHAAILIIKSMIKDAVITVNDVKLIDGGYITRK
jgi:uncharacterized protein YebE (UPF0316 family)